MPESTRGRRAWRQAAAQIEDYRHTYGITHPDQALGPVPHDPTQRAVWQQARQMAQQAKGRQRSIARQQQRAAATRPQLIDRSQQEQAPTRPARVVPPRRPGPERAAG
jgi:hypothetical protein